VARERLGRLGQGFQPHIGCEPMTCGSRQMRPTRQDRSHARSRPLIRVSGCPDRSCERFVHGDDRSPTSSPFRTSEVMTAKSRPETSWVRTCEVVVSGYTLVWFPPTDNVRQVPEAIGPTPASCGCLSTRRTIGQLGRDERIRHSRICLEAAAEQRPPAGCRFSSEAVIQNYLWNAVSAGFASTAGSACR
jgi:hypothetical protein